MKMKCAAVIETRGSLSPAAAATASRDCLFQLGNARFDASLAAPAQKYERKE